MINKKKLITALCVLLTAMTVSVSAEYILPEDSQLTALFTEDFQRFGVMKNYKNLSQTSGWCSSRILNETDNNFLRIVGMNKSGNIGRIKFNRPISGEIAIEFDMRVSGYAPLQIPSVLGVGENQKINSYIARVSMNGTGSVSLNNTLIGSYTGLRSEWKHFCLYINTEKDICKAVIDENISADIPVLTAAKSITGIEFTINGTETYIDLDNIKVYPCKLNIASGNNAEEIEYHSDKADFPLRRPRKERMKYRLAKFENAPKLDGSIEQKLELEEVTRVIEGTETDTKIWFGAGYTDEGIYIVLKAQDKTPIGGYADIYTWLMDSFEVFIDAGHERSSTYMNGDMQLTFTYNLDTVGSIPSNLAFKEQVKFKQLDTDDGWCVEVFVPAKLFGNYWMPKEFGFDIGYNDCAEKAGSRTAHFMWEGDAFNSKSTVSFGVGAIE